MKRTTRRTTILATLSAIIVLFLSVTFRPVAYADIGQAFSIAPPLLNLKASPGQTIVAQLQLTNISNNPMVMTAQANDFAAKDENGDPNIILNPNEVVPFSLRNWIQLPSPFTLAPKQMKTISVPIIVPPSGEPGGHYGVIRFTGSAPGTSGSGVSLSASIGTLVLLEVSGNIQERASLADFFAGDAQTFGKKAFFQTGPIGFVTRVSDDGDIHIQPTGTITVKNMLGMRIASLRVNGQSNSAQDPPKNILPASIRRFETTLENKWLFGRYAAHIDLAYGTHGKHLTADADFWVVPYRIVAPTLIGLVVIIFAARFAIKKYNAHIIKKAQAAGARPPKDN